MKDQKLSQFIQIRLLVRKGITSPSVIMKNVPSIRQWKTAKKYVEEALNELREESCDADEERVHMVVMLKELRSDILQKLSNTTHLNQYLGGVKNVLAINDQLMRLNPYQQPKDDKDKSWADIMREHHERRFKTD